MGNDWERVPLGDLFDVRSGLSKPRSAFGSGFPFLAFKDVFNNYFVPAQLSQLVNSTERERVLFSIKRGDVFLTRTSETFDELAMSSVALVDYDEATFNGFTKRLRPKRGGRVYPEFAGYFFRSPAFRRDVTALASMSTRASLNNEMLRRLEMLVPPVAEQKAIAGVLRPLDQKLELNRRTIQTLEQIARMMFHHTSHGATDGTLADIALLNPESWTKRTRPARIDYVDLSNTKWGRIEVTVQHDRATAPSRAQRVLRPGDTIVGTVRPGNGSFALVARDGLTGSTGFAVLRPRDPVFTEYVYLAATEPSRIRALAHVADGGAYPAVRPDVVLATPVCIPSRREAEDFAHVVGPLFRRIAAADSESATLASLRDTLLPKLISGELQIAA